MAPFSKAARDLLEADARRRKLDPGHLALEFLERLLSDPDALALLGDQDSIDMASAEEGTVAVTVADRHFSLVHALESAVFAYASEDWLSESEQREVGRLSLLAQARNSPAGTPPGGSTRGMQQASAKVFVEVAIRGSLTSSDGWRVSKDAAARHVAYSWKKTKPLNVSEAAPLEVVRLRSGKSGAWNVAAVIGGHEAAMRQFSSLGQAAEFVASVADHPIQSIEDALLGV